MAITSIDRRALMAGAAAVAAAPTRGFAQTLEPIRYLTPYGYLMAFVDAMYPDTSGIFREHGLDVTVEGGKGSAMSVQQVSAGNVLISRTGGTDLIKAYAKDPSLVAIGDCFPRDLFFVISHAERPVRTPADMAGKTIGLVSVGGATENILDMMLAKQGVPAAEVKRETVGNAPAAFEFVKAGRIAAFIATSDTVSALKLDKQPVLTWSSDDVAPAPGQVYIVSRRSLETRTATLGKFLSAINDGLGRMLAMPDPTPVLTSVLTKYDVFEAKRADKGVAVLRQSLAGYRPAVERRLKPDPATFASAYDLMVKAKIVQPLQEPKFFDLAAWQAAFG